MRLNLPCANAFLEIRDGPQEDSPLIGRFCDENKNNFVNFSSSQNHVVIRFVKRTNCFITFLQILYYYLQDELLIRKLYLSEYIQSMRIVKCWDSVYCMTHKMIQHL